MNINEIIPQISGNQSVSELFLIIEKIAFLQCKLKEMESPCLKEIDSSIHEFVSGSIDSANVHLQKAMSEIGDSVGYIISKGLINHFT